MKTILCEIVIACLFFSCTPKLNNGIYVSPNLDTKLKINNDSSFEYKMGAFHFRQYSEGSWKRKGNKIILNSTNQNKNIRLNVVEIENRNKSIEMNIKLNITGKFKLSDYRCQIFINDSLFTELKGDSLLKVSVNIPIESFYLLFIRNPESTEITYPITTERYLTKKCKSNLNVLVDFSDSLFFYEIFDNEKLKIRNRKLKMYYPNAPRKWGVLNLVHLGNK